MKSRQQLITEKNIQSGRIKPEQMALIIVDMQQGFMPATGKTDGSGELPVPEADKIIPAMNKMITSAKESGMKIIYTGDKHTPHSPSFSTTFDLRSWLDEHKNARVIYRGLIPAYLIEAEDRENYRLYPLADKSGTAIFQMPDKPLRQIENCLLQPVSEATYRILALKPLKPLTAYPDEKNNLMMADSHQPLLLDAHDPHSIIAAFSGVRLIPPHCIDGGTGFNFAKNLIPPDENSQIIYKGGMDHLLAGEVDAKSAVAGDKRLFVSDLPHYLAENNIKLAYVCGIAGDVCAYRTAFDLARMRDPDSEISQTLAQHPSLTNRHLEKLAQIQTLFIADLSPALFPARMHQLSQLLKESGAIVADSSFIQLSNTLPRERDR